MFPGGGGMNNRKMQQMMQQMGIEMQEIDAEEIVIRTPDEDLVFTEADVQRMDAKGQQTYTIVGEPESRPPSEPALESEAETTDETADAATAPTAESEDETPSDDGATIPAEDVELVAGRAGVSESDAREALEATDGDLAAAIDRLE